MWRTAWVVGFSICMLCMLFIPLIWRELRRRRNGTDVSHHTQGLKIDQINFKADEILKKVDDKDRLRDRPAGDGETTP